MENSPGLWLDPVNLCDREKNKKKMKKKKQIAVSHGKNHPVYASRFMRGVWLPAGTLDGCLLNYYIRLD